MTVLTAIMIVGITVIMVLMLIRLNRETPAELPALPALPAQLALPAGTEVEAVTAGRGWYAVVTRDARILIFDSVTGQLRQEIVVPVSAGEN